MDAGPRLVLTDYGVSFREGEGDVTRVWKCELAVEQGVGPDRVRVAIQSVVRCLPDAGGAAGVRMVRWAALADEVRRTEWPPEISKDEVLEALEQMRQARGEASAP